MERPDDVHDSKSSKEIDAQGVQNLRDLNERYQIEIAEQQKTIRRLEKLLEEKDQMVNELCGENMKQVATIDALSVKVRELRLAKELTDRSSGGSKLLSDQSEDSSRRSRSPAVDRHLERVNATKAPQSTYDSYLEWNERRKEQENAIHKAGILGLQDSTGFTQESLDDSRRRRSSNAGAGKSTISEIDEMDSGRSSASCGSSGIYQIHSPKDRELSGLSTSGRSSKGALPPLPQANSPNPRASTQLSASTTQVGRWPRSRSSSPAMLGETGGTISSPTPGTSGSANHSYWWSGLSSVPSTAPVTQGDASLSGDDRSRVRAALGNPLISNTKGSDVSLDIPKRSLVRTNSDLSCHSISDIDVAESLGLSALQDDPLVNISDSTRCVSKAASEGTTASPTRYPRVPTLPLSSSIINKSTLSRMTPANLALQDVDKDDNSPPSSTRAQFTSRILDDDLINSMPDHVSPRIYNKSSSEDVRMLPSYGFGK